MKSTFIIFASILLLTSCNKDDDGNTTPTTNSKSTIPTIEPLSYFPAFPSSYWVYDNGDTLKVADQYETYIFDYTGLQDFDTLNLPKLILNGIYNPNDTCSYVRGHSISKGSSRSGSRSNAFRGLLSTTEGAGFHIANGFAGSGPQGMTIKVDTSITIRNIQYDSVIIAVQYNFGCANADNVTYCTTIREYFAKNVGLIKRESRDSLGNAQYTKDFELVNYHINN